MEKSEDTSITMRRVHGRRGLFYQLEVLRDLRAEMPIQTAPVLLAIAMRPGLLQRNVPDLIGISQSSAYRNINALSTRDRHGKLGLGLGLGLIIQTPGPAGSRSPALHLPTLGYETVKRLVGTEESRVR